MSELHIPVMTKRVKLTNLVPAMDSLSFEVRSSSGSCEMSTAHAKYGSKALCNTGVSGYNEMYSMTTTKFKLIPSHIYYACVEVYQETKLGSIDFFWPSGSPSMFGGKAPGNPGTWTKWSNVTNRSTFAEGEYPIRLDFNNGGTAGKIWYDGLMLIDLTEAFGAGNEPGNAWCQANIPYFTGTKSLGWNFTNLAPAINGTDGFTFNGSNGTRSCEASITHTKYAAQSLKMSLGSDCAEVCASSKSTYPLNPSHKYYARVEAYQEVARGTMEIYFPIAEPHMFNTNAGVAGKWNMYSSVCDRSTFSNGNYAFRLDFNRGSDMQSCEVWYDGLMLIDLTAACGAGNEPTKEWCDANIPYFEGDYEYGLAFNSPIQSFVKGLNISKVPSGYTELDYIESSGTQYIDSGISGNNDNLTISAKFNMLSFTSYRGVFGNYSSEAANCVRLILTNTDNNRYYVNNNTSGGSGTSTISNLEKNVINEVIVTTGEVIANGVSKAYTATAKGTDNNNNILIFTQNGKANQGSTMRLYSFKIADRGVLVRDFIPVKRIADNTLGLYDLVNDTFYTNVGTGTFTSGTTISGTVMEIKDVNGRVLWMVNGDKVILQVEKITSDTYAGETTYTGEQFILLDIYPKTNRTVKVTYGGLTKTITDTSGAEEPNAQQVFFGIFNGVPDDVTTPASGELIIEGGLNSFAIGSYEKAKGKTTYCSCITAVNEWGAMTEIPDGAFKYCTNLELSEIPEGITTIGRAAFYECQQLKNITLPSTLQTLYTNAFAKDDVVDDNSVYGYPTNIFMLSKIPPELIHDGDTYGELINTGSGEQINEYPLIFVPEDCLDVYKTADIWSSYVKHMLEIGHIAFSIEYISGFDCRFAIEGMTWDELINSEYNTDGIYISGNDIMCDFIVGSEKNSYKILGITLSDTIIHRHNYESVRV